MKFFQYAYKQSEKGLGKAFLFSLVLGLLFSISILVVVVKAFSSLDAGALKEFADETGCRIVNYELTCNRDYYEYDGMIIDLDYNDTNVFRNDVILTKNSIIAQGNIYNYRELLDSFGKGPDFDVNDASDLIESLAAFVYVLVFIFTFIGGTIYFIIANILLAAIMLGIFKSFKNYKIKYEQMYKLTIFTSIPYVAFNALTRMLIDYSLTGLIASFLPVGGGFVRIILDYAVIFGLTLLAFKAGYQEPVTTVEMPFTVTPEDNQQ